MAIEITDQRSIANRQARSGHGNLESLKLRDFADQHLKDEQRSYLDRHHPQIEWIKQHLMSSLVDQLNASTPLKVAVLGCSTGEECVRLFAELSSTLRQLQIDSHVEVCGIELDKELAKEASRRLTGRSPLKGTHEHKESDYAKEILALINHDNDLRTKLDDHVRVLEGDITKVDSLPMICGPAPQIIVLNHTLRIFKEDVIQKVYGELSNTFPNSVIAIGDLNRVISLVLECNCEHLNHKLPEQEGLTNYIFCLPGWTHDRFPRLWDQ